MNISHIINLMSNKRLDAISKAIFLPTDICKLIARLSIYDEQDKLELLLKEQFGSKLILKIQTNICIRWVESSSDFRKIMYDVTISGRNYSMHSVKQVSLKSLLPGNPSRIWTAFYPTRVLQPDYFNNNLNERYSEEMQRLMDRFHD